MRGLRVFFPLLLPLSAPVAAQELPRSLFFEPSLERALERATRIRRPVLVAVHAAGDEKTRQTFETLYLDPVVKQLSREIIVCLACGDDHPAVAEGPEKGRSTLFPGLTPEELKAVDQAVRQKYFAGGTCRKPAHLVLDPLGNLMQAKEGSLTKEELVQLVRDGLDAVDLNWNTAAPPSAREPGDAKKKRPDAGLAKGANATPPWSGIFEANDVVRRATIEELFATGDDALVLKLYHQLRDDKDQQARIEFLRMAAKEGHKPPVSMFIDALEDKDPLVRSHGAVSLEITRLADGVAPLQKALRKEKDERVLADMVRGLGASGHHDDAALETVLKYTRDRSDTIRANAYVALRFAGEKPKVKEALQKRGLSDNDTKAKHAAIWTLGFMRDKSARELLEKEQKKERGPMGGLLIRTAISLIDGGEMLPIYLREVRQFTGETISREPAKMPKAAEEGPPGGENERERDRGRKG
jgi:HEAT repeat protein